MSGERVRLFAESHFDRPTDYLIARSNDMNISRKRPRLREAENTYDFNGVDAPIMNSKFYNQSGPLEDHDRRPGSDEIGFRRQPVQVVTLIDGDGLNL